MRACRVLAQVLDGGGQPQAVLRAVLLLVLLLGLGAVRLRRGGGGVRLRCGRWGSVVGRARVGVRWVAVGRGLLGLLGRLGRAGGKGGGRGPGGGQLLLARGDLFLLLLQLCRQVLQAAGVLLGAGAGGGQLVQPRAQGAEFVRQPGGALGGGGVLLAQGPVLGGELLVAPGQAVVGGAELADSGYAARSRNQNRFTDSTTGARRHPACATRRRGSPGEQGERMTGQIPQRHGEESAGERRAALFSDAATDRPTRTAPARPPLETLVWQAPGEQGSAR
ncbi:hypothetical protein [Streptomyces sp. NPDC059788]|uniref:hypothetical protein n=1 Tax=Streptomyces sp. NPDC059788 TaxID=3346948 RepID=UPI00364CF481